MSQKIIVFGILLFACNVTCMDMCSRTTTADEQNALNAGLSVSHITGIKQSLDDLSKKCNHQKLIENLEKALQDVDRGNAYLITIKADKKSTSYVKDKLFMNCRGLVFSLVDMLISKKAELQKIANDKKTRATISAKVTTLLARLSNL